MKNCLVTKLKSVVDNEALEKIGTFRFKLTVPNGLSNYSRYWLQISDSPGVKIHVTNGKHIYEYNNSTPTQRGTDLGEDTVTASWNNYCFADAGEYYVEISKYELYKVRFPIEAEFSVNKLSFVPLLTLFIGCYKTSGTLSDISKTLVGLTIEAESGNNNKFDINLDDLSKLVNISTLQSYGYPLEGNVSQLGKIEKIRTLYFSGSRLTGSIEGFVKSQVSVGNTTKSITWQYLHRSNITFNNHTFADGYNTTFSWQPSQTAGKTVITNGSETVEIDN